MNATQLLNRAWLVGFVSVASVDGIRLTLGSPPPVYVSANVGIHAGKHTNKAKTPRDLGVCCVL